MVPHLDPADAPLPRERAKQPYTRAEIAGYLALADAQPTTARAMRASALVCLGAGAGLIRSDLRSARGTDIACRSGGVVVQVHGRAPRAVPVLARYHERLLGAAAFAGENFLTGGDKPEPGNLTNPLTRSLADGSGLPPWTPPGCAPPGSLTSRSCSACPPSCTPLGSPAPSGSATSSSAWTRPAARSTGWRCSAAGPGEWPVGSAIPLARLEEITDTSHAAPAIEALLPAGVRRRQLRARTLLLGMQLALADRRPAYLTEVHAALTSLPEHDQKRLGVIEDWKDGPHQLTYRQVEHTSRLITKALAKAEPDGAPSRDLQQLSDQLAEASIPGPLKNASSSLAVDWTDAEAWSRPVPASSPGTGTGPEARWGHRNVNRTISQG